MTDPVKTAKLTDLKDAFQHDIDGMTEKVKEHLKDDGLKCNDSQRVCFINMLGTLQAYVNGLSVDDLN